MILSILFFQTNSSLLSCIFVSLFISAFAFILPFLMRASDLDLSCFSRNMSCTIRLIMCAHSVFVMWTYSIYVFPLSTAFIVAWIFFFLSYRQIISTFIATREVNFYNALNLWENTWFCLSLAVGTHKNTHFILNGRLNNYLPNKAWQYEYEK